MDSPPLELSPSRNKALYVLILLTFSWVFLLEYWHRNQCFKRPVFTVLQQNLMKTAQIAAAACHCETAERLGWEGEGGISLTFSLSFFLLLCNSWLLTSRLVLKPSDMMWESKIITCQGFHLHKRQGVRSSFKTCRSSSHAVTLAWTLRNQLLLTLKTQHSSPCPARPCCSNFGNTRLFWSLGCKGKSIENGKEKMEKGGRRLKVPETQPKTQLYQRLRVLLSDNNI